MSNIGGVSYVSADDEQIKVSQTTRTPKNDLSKDAFMQLLVTQLQYQDPLNPMDNQAFMAQMAQFSALEQMMNMSSSMDKANAHALIGKVVEAIYRDPATNQQSTITGNVDSVRTKNGKNTLMIGGKEVELKDVSGVIDSNLVSDTNITSGFELLEQTVQAFVTNKETNEQFIYEGEVQQVQIKNGKPHIVLGAGENKVEIPIDQVQNVVKKPTITGKHAVGTITDEQGNEATIEGMVEYIIVLQDKIQVCIEGNIIPFEQVQTVYKQ